MHYLHPFEKKLTGTLELEKQLHTAVDILTVKRLMVKGEKIDKLKDINKHTKNDQAMDEELLLELSGSYGLSFGTTGERERRQNTREINDEMYPVEDHDPAMATAFLLLAKAWITTHYEILKVMTKEINDQKFAFNMFAILVVKSEHFQLCTKLAKLITFSYHLQIQICHNTISILFLQVNKLTFMRKKRTSIVYTFSKRCFIGPLGSCNYLLFLGIVTRLKACINIRGARF